MMASVPPQLGADTHSRRSLRVGIVCPYSFDAPGGVQNHVVELAEALRQRGHHVHCIAPGDPTLTSIDHLTLTGKSVAVKYNGSVARLSVGPRTVLHVRRWIREGRFDVLHIHEPSAPSIGLVALACARGPLVATFHTAAERSNMLRNAHRVLVPLMEKLRGRIAVSALARRLQMQSLGSDAVEIPNGIWMQPFTDAANTVDKTRTPSVTFMGRLNEPRKGLDIFAQALLHMREHLDELIVNIVGEGTLDPVWGQIGSHFTVIEHGRVSDEQKARLLASSHIYCAPNLGGESFGIVLLEAMAAGATLVASDLDAFTRVTDNGRVAQLYPTGNPAALADCLMQLLGDEQRQLALRHAAALRAHEFDWCVVSQKIEDVYYSVCQDEEQVTVGRGEPTLGRFVT